jgi:hypothetical protein
MLVIIGLVAFIVFAFAVAEWQGPSEDRTERLARPGSARRETDTDELGVLLRAL